MSRESENIAVDSSRAQLAGQPDWLLRRLFAAMGVSLCAVSLVLSSHARVDAHDKAEAEAARQAAAAEVAAQFAQWREARHASAPSTQAAPGEGEGEEPDAMPRELELVRADLSDLVDYDFTELEIARVKADERRCMAEAIYYESRNESMMGKLGVADVVLNRVDSPYWPDTVCGVVYQGAHRTTGCQFSFTCDGSMDKRRNETLYAELDELAGVILAGMHMPVSRNATHYHADYASPYWAPSMTPTAQIGAHKFYRFANKKTQSVAAAAQ